MEWSGSLGEGEEGYKLVVHMILYRMCSVEDRELRM